jgi:hypothetical protein
VISELAVTVYLAIGSTISAYAWLVCRRRGEPLSDPAIVVGVVLVGLFWPVTDCRCHRSVPGELAMSDTVHRSITAHHVNAANRELRIDVLDLPGAGGACHLYRISGFNTESNPSSPFEALCGKPAEHSTVLFQNGPIGEVGVNGVTHEALLAILIDRMQAFQKGPFACSENEMGLSHLRCARVWLNARTARRVAQGVEGTHEKDKP